MLSGFQQQILSARSRCEETEQLREALRRERMGHRNAVEGSALLLAGTLLLVLGPGALLSPATARGLGLFSFALGAVLLLWGRMRRP